MINKKVKPILTDNFIYFTRLSKYPNANIKKL